MLLKCKECDQMYSGTRSLQRHMVRFHKYKTKVYDIITCKMCKRTFMRQSTHDKHMRNKHSDFPIHIFHVQEQTGAKQDIEPETCKSSAHPPPYE